MNNERHIEVLHTAYGILNGLARGFSVNRSGTAELLPAAKEAFVAAEAALRNDNPDARARALQSTIDFLKTELEATRAAHKELDRNYVEAVEGALQPETFDPQAVRELLDTIRASPVLRSVADAAQRVRETEKK